VDKPLRIMHAGDAYRRMVLGGDVLQDGTVRTGLGFPGPAMHGRAYIMLKERQIATLLRESKTGQSRRARVVFLSGVRRAESQRRATREPISRARRSSAVFANPLLNWSSSDMAVYRQAHRIPESDAAALLHRSGECNCGAFASAEHERAMLKALYPDFFASIEALEAEAEAAGLRWCRWGGYDRAGNRATQAAKPTSGPLCEACDARQSATVEAS
jgi:3'-phosphoadenosine 5'-phosphosulfate sulfotransferase (PAPS reductase)/FAD synthetase